MSRQSTGLLAFLIVVAVPAAATAPAPVGHLLSLKGSVQVRRMGQPPRAATLLLPLQTGDVLAVGAGGATEVVLFQNGARYALAGRGTARVERGVLRAVTGMRPKALTPVGAALVRRGARVPAGDTRVLGMLLRPVEERGLGPCRPTPDGGVRATPVTLRWSGPIEAEALHLRIRAGERIVYEEELPPAARAFPVPSGVLQPGVNYVWSVTGVTGGDRGVSCRALVRVLLPEEATEIARLEREADAAPDDTAPRLLLAWAYERVAMRGEARAAYETVQRQRPDDTGVRAALRRLTPRENMP